MHNVPVGGPAAGQEGTQVSWKGSLGRERRVRVAGTVKHLDDLGAVAEEYRGLLLQRARASLRGEPDAAEDVVQDALLELAERGSAPGAYPSLAHAALGLVRIRAYLRERFPGKRPASFDAQRPVALMSADPAQVVEDRLLLVAIWGALTPGQRHVMADRLIGRTLQEMADERKRPFSTTSTAIHRARKRARHVREAWTIVLLPAWRRATDVLWRTARRCGCVVDAIVAEPFHAVGVLVVICTVSTLAPRTSRPPGPARVAVEFEPTWARSSQTTVGSRAVVAMEAPPGGQAAKGRSNPTPPQQVGSMLPFPTSATTETPEDTQLVSAAPSPHFAEDHTIVALGSGGSCNCPVLLRSTDGGATWAAAAGSPPYGRKIILPPGYPADARIFVSNAASGGVPNFVAPAFGRSFVPLPIPPGDIAFSAHYSRGDPRLFVAGIGAVWSLSDAGVGAPVLLYPNGNQAATLATPIGDPEAAVLIVAPRGAATAAMPVPTQAVALFACGRSTPCAAISTLPNSTPSTVLVSPRFATDRTLLFVGQAGIDVSRDGGHTVGPVALPGGQPSSAALVAAASAGSPTVWTGLQRGGSSVVVRFSLGSTRWVDVTADPVLRNPGLLVAIDADRVLAVIPGFGFRCTADGGATWKARCPAL